MDILTPPLLTAIREVRWHVLAGRPVKSGVLEYLNTHQGEFAVRLHELWVRREQHPAHRFHSHREQTFWELIMRGDRGEPVLEALTELERDVERAVQHDLEAHIATLPFKALVPLLLFQFPAFVILLIGPLLRELSRHAFVFVVLVAWLMVGPPATATEALNSIAARRFARAVSVTEVDKIERELNEIRVARLACAIQLRERNFPTACYQALHLEKAWRVGAQNHHLWRAQLDARCSRAGREYRGQPVMGVKFLSRSCHKALVQARELWSYRQTSNPPDSWREN